MTMSSKSDNNGHNGDTTLTKVFVGGLAWETPKDAMHDHFVKFGEIIEAVIITDKISGRSKGYGFVTFKDPEAAKKACEDATPTINGRRANCNLAALGARRPPRSLSATPPPQQRHQVVSNNVGGNALRGPTSGTPPASQVQWYYAPAGTCSDGSHAQPASLHAHQLQPVPFYPAGYSPAYITAHDHVSYNNKVSYNNSGAYMNGHYAQMYQSGQPMIAGANTFMPMYPFYPYAQHHSHQQGHHAAVGLPAHYFQPASPGPITASPPIISKPTTPVCIAAPTQIHMEQGRT